MSINPAYVEDTDGEHAHSELEDSGKLHQFMKNVGDKNVVFCHQHSVVS